MKRKLPSWITAGSAGPDDVQDTGPVESEEVQVEQVELVKSNDAEAEDDDDYLSMTFDGPNGSKTATSLIGGREKRLLERQSRARQGGASPTVPLGPGPSTKAMKMMERMGYVSGQALGNNKDGRGITEPLEAPETVSRGGLGLENQKRRRIREQAALAVRQVEEEQTDFRDSVRSELEERRIEGRIQAAKKVCETLDSRASRDGGEEDDGGGGDKDTLQDPTRVNVLWRSLVLRRRERERERMLRQQMLDASTSFSKREYNDDDDDDDGHGHAAALTPGQASAALRRTVYEADGGEEDEDEDGELSAFESLDAALRLERILAYLRTRHCYCFWCGCAFTDEQDLGHNCPGATEEMHE